MVQKLECVVVLVQVRAIGMASPELLQLVENCPTGAETLIARILNILTDKSRSFTPRVSLSVCVCVPDSLRVCLLLCNRQF